jgi:hypothetical protein
VTRVIRPARAMSGLALTTTPEKTAAESSFASGRMYPSREWRLRFSGAFSFASCGSNSRYVDHPQ